MDATISEVDLREKWERKIICTLGSPAKKRWKAHMLLTLPAAPLLQPPQFPLTLPLPTLPLPPLPPPTLRLPTPPMPPQLAPAEERWASTRRRGSLRLRIPCNSLSDCAPTGRRGEAAKRK